ncbi:PEPxxWA-CTERM sorting domain-containing protein [Phenylobacterium sp.]|uniref:PEPxxWA-CTERM sorting domain-containing protein n=1 Tax=Phenylobacterium sp. TaxID=1871053 RepID=UPI002FC5E36D
MKFSIAAMAAAATVSLAAPAHALTVIASPVDTPPPADQFVIYDFDGYVAPGYTLTLSGAAGTFDGSLGLFPGVAAPPPGTTTNYLAIRAGGAATLDTPLISAVSVYIGSPDAYNAIRFIGLNGFDETLTGAALAGGAFNGDQTIGRRMTYNFGSDRVTKVIFYSTGNSFELDNIAVATAVPEPATWAMMIVGFGLMGAAVRRRRQTAWPAAYAHA